MFVTVLRELLLKQLDNGAFEPKKLKREKVKEVLLSFRRTLQETARSECTNCSVTGVQTCALPILRNRVLVTVLRESLLKQLDNGAFEPKKLKHEKVKEVLLSFRRNLQENARSECTESRLTTFDYV